MNNIIGMYSAHEHAKSIGIANMEISSRLVIEMAEEIEAQNRIIAELENPWISVGETLPEFHTQILFYADNEIFKGAFYRSSHKFRSHKFRSYGKYTESMFHKDDVTHWMPLPKSPKEQSE